MPQAVTGFFGRIRSAISGFTLAQRTIAIIGVAVLALGAVALGSWLMRPQYAPLFTGLAAADASAVVEQLQSAGVDYQLADGGSTVLVPEQDVYDQRLAAAAAGLPGEGTNGYTLLDDLGVTTSEFQQSVTYKRAIEGELARTISSLDGVTGASVQLAIPEESVFVSETIDPTASVFVETQSGATLDRQQVDAIVHLTAAAISGMKPENVAVIDQSGETLSAVGVGTTGSSDQQAAEYETRVAASVQQMLDRVVGAGNATVSVAAEMSNETSERVDETYTTPEDALPTEEQTRTESYTGGGTGTGVLGPDNIAVPTEGGDGTYESTETNRSNAINKSTEKTTTPPGAVTRQTVSVAVDEDAAAGLNVGELEDLVATAAGVDPDRGDEVTVATMAFSTADADAAQAALAQARADEEAQRAHELMTTALIAAAIGLPLLAAVIVFAVRARRRRAAETEPMLALDETPTLLLTQQQEPELFPGTTPSLESAAPTVPLEIEPDPEPEPDQQSLARHRVELEALARRDPEKTAEALRALMGETVDA
ncbi:flagellar basal-body MS-ring/collar protein FliF [Microbacterium sediminis]|uniref:Flagellar M-ring protein n=1 Tax=Microbacterium sediminis TaxID=904291 RepID=A0A1B9NIY1_9MICO|nr:flagellar basal-body MS-ring/collar protein FliF [Microbacterium sediminis]OCG76562.1 flagellar M-ring protein FliF [Microbacterium sediminis]QBR73834.1 flagellar M-ring protein FliF [Microbacterium sediminis]